MILLTNKSSTRRLTDLTNQKEEAMKLAEKSCTPVKEGDRPYTTEEASAIMGGIDPEWRLLSDGTKLMREFRFKNFSGPMKLAMIVGDIAESENHHPDLHIRWGYLAVVITTHDLGGLAESDFIYAAKVDNAFAQFEKLL